MEGRDCISGEEMQVSSSKLEEQSTASTGCSALTYLEITVRSLEHGSCLRQAKGRSGLEAQPAKRSQDQGAAGPLGQLDQPVPPSLSGDTTKTASNALVTLLLLSHSNPCCSER